MAFDHGATDREAEPHAFALGRVERLEQAARVGDAGTAIRHADHHPVGVVGDANGDGVARHRTRLRGDRFERVAQQVEQHLLDHHAVAIDPRRRIVRLHVDVDLQALRERLDQCQRLGQQIEHLVRVVLDRSLLNEAAQALDDLSGAVRLFAHPRDGIFDLLHLRRVAGEEAVGHRRVVRDRRQRLVQLVGDARCELGQARQARSVLQQLVALARRAGRLALGRDVGRDVEQHGRAVDPRHRAPLDVVPAAAAGVGEFGRLRLRVEWMARPLHQTAIGIGLQREHLDVVAVAKQQPAVVERAHRHRRLEPREHRVELLARARQRLALIGQRLLRRVALAQPPLQHAQQPEDQQRATEKSSTAHP